MGKFKHHSYFTKKKNEQSYLLPNVCFNCCKSFKKPVSDERRLCPQCGIPLTALSRKFSAPRSSETEQWRKVRFLVDHGFFFQSVYEIRADGHNYRVMYPRTLAEAKEFVIKYKAQSPAKTF